MPIQVLDYVMIYLCTRWVDDFFSTLCCPKHETALFSVVQSRSLPDRQHGHLTPFEDAQTTSGLKLRNVIKGTRLRFFLIELFR